MRYGYDYYDYDYEYENARDDARADALAEEREQRLAELEYEHPDLSDEELQELLAEEEEDRCGCSDPCCPCNGVKRGVP